MPRRPYVRIVLPAILAVTLLVTAAFPSPAQTTPLVEGLLDEVGQIEGINQLDPVLNPVSDLILTLTTLVDETLAEVPLVNTLALGGDDAVDAGVAFSQATFPEGATTAILSREDLYADGLASGAFQGRFDAPLLYTDSEDLDPRTGMELQRLGMDTVTILGGEDALHPIVVNKLQLAGLNVVRIGGPTRVETSVEAARATLPDATHVVLVRAYPDAGQPDGQAYADLLAAGPYAAENGWPILMTTSDSLHPAVAAHLADSGVTDVTIIGGTQAVSQAVQDGLVADGLTVDRVAGDNRFATAVAIAEARGFENAAMADRVVIAEQGGREDVWAPGFSATAHSEQNAAPVLLTDGPLIPAETLAFLADGLTENLVDGGPAVICASFVDPVACEAVGALMLLNLGLVEDLLGTLEGIPLLGDILAEMGLAGLLGDGLDTLLDLLDTLGVSPDQIASVLAVVASGDAAQVQALIDGLSEGLDLPLDGITDVLEGTTTVEGLVESLIDPVTGGDTGGVDQVIDDVVGGIVGGLLSGGGGSGSDGGSGEGAGDGAGEGSGGIGDVVDGVVGGVVGGLFGG